MATKGKHSGTTESEKGHDRDAPLFNHLFHHFRRVLEDLSALEMANMDDFYTWRRMHCCVTTLLLEMQRPVGEELHQGPPFDLEILAVTTESLQTTTLQENADTLRQLISDIRCQFSKRTGYTKLQGFLKRAHRLYYERQWLLQQQEARRQVPPIVLPVPQSNTPRVPESHNQIPVSTTMNVPTIVSHDAKKAGLKRTGSVCPEGQSAAKRKLPSKWPIGQVLPLEVRWTPVGTVQQNNLSPKTAREESPPRSNTSALTLTNAGTSDQATAHLPSASTSDSLIIQKTSLAPAAADAPVNPKRDSSLATVPSERGSLPDTTILVPKGIGHSAAIENRFSAMDARFNAMETRINAMNARSDSIDSCFNSLASTLLHLIATMRHVRSLTPQIQHELEVLSHEVMVPIPTSCNVMSPPPSEK